EERLGSQSAQFEIVGDRRGPFDERVIQEWHANFERVRHARSIHLLEDVSLQVHLYVPVKEPVDGMLQAGLPVMRRNDFERVALLDTGPREHQLMLLSIREGTKPLMMPDA